MQHQTSNNTFTAIIIEKTCGRLDFFFRVTSDERRAKKKKEVNRQYQMYILVGLVEEVPPSKLGVSFSSVTL